MSLTRSEALKDLASASDKLKNELKDLAKDPAQRPQSARELSARLGEIDGASAWTQERARDWWTTHRPAK